MRIHRVDLRAFGFALCTLISLSGTSRAQDHHEVVIPNPTPRDPDLTQVYGNTPEDREKQRRMSAENQLRAREIWLESNQILLLAQQLQQEIVAGKKSVSMQTNAARAGQIEKLAKSVREKMSKK
jgi:hypothetical protein